MQIVAACVTLTALCTQPVWPLCIDVAAQSSLHTGEPSGLFLSFGFRIICILLMPTAQCVMLTLAKLEQLNAQAIIIAWMQCGSSQRTLQAPITRSVVIAQLASRCPRRRRDGMQDHKQTGAAIAHRQRLLHKHWQTVSLPLRGLPCATLGSQR